MIFFQKKDDAAMRAQQGDGLLDDAVQEFVNVPLQTPRACGSKQIVPPVSGGLGHWVSSP